MRRDPVASRESPATWRYVALGALAAGLVVLAGGCNDVQDEEDAATHTSNEIAREEREPPAVDPLHEVERLAKRDRSPSPSRAARLREMLLAGLQTSPSTRAGAGARTRAGKLDRRINTGVPETLPVLTADGSRLYFARLEPPIDEAWIERRCAEMQATSSRFQDARRARGDEEKTGAVYDLFDRIGTDAERCGKDRAWTVEHFHLQEPDHVGRRHVDATTPVVAYVSERGPDGAWRAAEKLPSPIFNERSTAVVAALPDDITVFFYRRRPTRAVCEVPVAPPECDSDWWKIERAGNNWKEPLPLVVANFEIPDDPHALTVSPDGRALVLSYEPPNTSSGRDLFVSVFDEEHGWSEPRNLGSRINTREDETAPSVAPDGHTLYFTAGDGDIYVTRRLDDGWRKWSQPIRLEHLSTRERNRHLSVDAAGRIAVVATKHASDEDLYEQPLEETAAPLATAWVTGRVRTPDDLPLASELHYWRLDGGIEAGVAASDPCDGSYQIALPVGHRYGFVANARGFVAVSQSMDLTGASRGDVVERDLVLLPLEEGRAIRLENIFFEFNKAELRPESRFELDRLVRLLGDHESMEIAIEGHTDWVGTDSFNEALSQARAQAVVNYLTAHRVDAGRLAATGFGETRPIASNETPEGRQLNRRVEFRVTALDEVPAPEVVAECSIEAQKPVDEERCPKSGRSPLRVADMDVDCNGTEPVDPCLVGLWRMTEESALAAQFGSGKQSAHLSFEVCGRITLEVDDRGRFAKVYEDLLMRRSRVDRQGRETDREEVGFVGAVSGCLHGKRLSVGPYTGSVVVTNLVDTVKRSRDLESRRAWLRGGDLWVGNDLAKDALIDAATTGHRRHQWPSKGGIERSVYTCEGKRLRVGGRDYVRMAGVR